MTSMSSFAVASPFACLFIIVILYTKVFSTVQNPSFCSTGLTDGNQIPQQGLYTKQASAGSRTRTCPCHLSVFGSFTRFWIFLVDQVDFHNFHVTTVQEREREQNTQDSRTTRTLDDNSRLIIRRLLTAYIN